MYNDVIKLLSAAQSTNNIGDVIDGTPTEKEVFVKVKSINQNEFYQAQASGFKPEIKFVLKDYYDYNDEKQVKYNDIIYDVIRTYRNNNEMELTCVKGVNNASS